MRFRAFLPRLILVVLGLAAVVLPGCNTMSGMGRDISSAGNSMECCAEKSK